MGASHREEQRVERRVGEEGFRTPHTSRLSGQPQRQTIQHLILLPLPKKNPTRSVNAPASHSWAGNDSSGGETPTQFRPKFSWEPRFHTHGRPLRRHRVVAGEVERATSTAFSIAPALRQPRARQLYVC